MSFRIVTACFSGRLLTEQPTAGRSLERVAVKAYYVQRQRAASPGFVGRGVVHLRCDVVMGCPDIAPPQSVTTKSPESKRSEPGLVRAGGGSNHAGDVLRGWQDAVAK